MKQYKLLFIRQHYITTTCYCYKTLHNMLSNFLGTAHRRGESIDPYFEKERSTSMDDTGR